LGFLAISFLAVFLEAWNQASGEVPHASQSQS
jgi:hypothetical protein